MPRLLWAVDNAGYVPNTAGLQESVPVPAGVERGKVRTIYEWRATPIPRLLADRMCEPERGTTRRGIRSWMEPYGPPAEYTVVDIESVQSQQSGNGIDQLTAALTAFPHLTWGELFAQYCHDLYEGIRRVNPTTKVGMFCEPYAESWRANGVQFNIREAERDTTQALRFAAFVSPETYGGGQGIQDLIRVVRAQHEVARAVQIEGQEYLTFINVRAWCPDNPARHMTFLLEDEIYVLLVEAIDANSDAIAIWDVVDGPWTAAMMRQWAALPLTKAMTRAAAYAAAKGITVGWVKFAQAQAAVVSAFTPADAAPAAPATAEPPPPVSTETAEARQTPEPSMGKRSPTPVPTPAPAPAATVAPAAPPAPRTE
jgi:hypothetical protein